jgi:GNAT superfamily N-acetyltransferase
MGRELAALRDLVADSHKVGNGVRIEEVVDEAGIDAWLDVAVACGWFDGAEDRAARRRVFVALGLAPERPLRHWIARRGEAPVAFATAFYADDAVLLDNLGVLETEQRAGIGTALAGARLREALERGCRHAVLAPSPEGAHLYRTLGFELSPTPAGRWFYLP